MHYSGQLLIDHHSREQVCARWADVGLRKYAPTTSQGSSIVTMLYDVAKTLHSIEGAGGVVNNFPRS